jgi:hypothetical protein
VASASGVEVLICGEYSFTLLFNMQRQISMIDVSPYLHKSPFNIASSNQLITEQNHCDVDTSDIA